MKCWGKMLVRGIRRIEEREDKSRIQLDFVGALAENWAPTDPETGNLCPVLFEGAVFFKKRL